MPLRDHFRPPVEKRHSWDELHGDVAGGDRPEALSAYCRTDLSRPRRASGDGVRDRCLGLSSRTNRRSPDAG